MIKRLKSAGIKFDNGLSEAEFEKIYQVFGVTFPQEIKAFLECGMPCIYPFINWRDNRKWYVENITNFQDSIKEDFIFDFENNALHKLFAKKFENITNENDLKDAVLKYFDKSAKLIPFYGHRCFFNGMDNMPIVSYCQPSDVIFYGTDFENYLENEFLRKGQKLEIGDITDDFLNTGIWYDLIW